MKKLLTSIGVLTMLLSFGPGYNLHEGFYPINRVFAETGASVGKEMPVFNATTLAGDNVQVGGSGTPYVLNFWASWCPPCRDEFPEINSFANSHTDDLQYYGINIEESAATVNKFLQNNGYNLPILLNSDGSIANQFRVRSLPTTIVVDAQGIIRYRKTGEVTKKELDDVIANL